MIAPGEITQLLTALRDGDRSALDRLFPSRDGARATHFTTALVHEAYRIHFFAVASRAMRQILVNYARGDGPPAGRHLGN
jgi:hypothetical protein